MSTLYELRKEILKRGENVDAKLVHQVKQIERYISNNSGELITEIDDNSVMVYSKKRNEYLLRIDTSSLN